jgi:hypothetical protein
MSLIATSQRLRTNWGEKIFQFLWCFRSTGWILPCLSSSAELFFLLTGLVLIVLVWAVVEKGEVPLGEAPGPDPLVLLPVRDLGPEESTVTVGVISGIGSGDVESLDFLPGADTVAMAVVAESPSSTSPTWAVDRLQPPHKQG